ncbi:MAG: flagellar protein FlaG [Bacteroidota bacterium]
MIQGVEASKVESLIKGEDLTIKKPGAQSTSGPKQFSEARTELQTDSTSVLAVDTSSLIGPSPIKKELEEAEISIEKFLSEFGNKSIQFEKDKSTGRMVIQIVNKETNEVERQIPPKEFLELVANLNKVSAELLKDLPKFI